MLALRPAGRAALVELPPQKDPCFCEIAGQIGVHYLPVLKQTPLKSKTGAGGQGKVQVVRVQTADVISAVTRAAGKLRQGEPVARAKCERHRGIG